MSQIVLGASRAYPNIPTVGETLESHSRALEAVVEALEVAQRRTKDIGDSFVRVNELETLGLATVSGSAGSIIIDTGGEEATTHHHDGTYLLLDGSNDPVTGHVVFELGLDSGADITMTAGAINWYNASSVAVEFLNFASAAGAPIEVGHYSNQINSEVSVTNSGAYTTIHTPIAAGVLTTGDDYLVVARSFVSADSAANHAEPTDNDIRFKYGAVTLASIKTSERDDSAVHGGAPSRAPEFGTAKIITATDATALILEAQTADSPENDVTAEFSQVWALNLTDLGSSAYIPAVAKGGLDILGQTEDSFDNLGSAYNIGDGVSDYVLFVTFSCAFTETHAGGVPDYECWIQVDGGPWTDADLWRIGGNSRQHDGESYSHTGILVLPAAAAADIQFKAAWHSAGFPDDVGTITPTITVIALNLNNFAQHEIVTSADLTDPVGSGETEPLTASTTSTATSSDWGFLAGISSYFPGSGYDAQFEMRADVNGAGDADCAGTQAVTGDADQSEMMLHSIFPITDTNVNNADTLDFGLFGVAAPVTGADEWGAAGIVAFSYYTTPSTETFTVGDPSYATLIDGSSVTIDSTLNVTGAVDLDTTLNVDGIADFNANVDINDGTLTIYDTTGADSMAASHDGSNFDTVFTGTSAANWTGASGFYVFDNNLSLQNATSKTIFSTIWGVSNHSMALSTTGLTIGQTSDVFDFDGDVTSWTFDNAIWVWGTSGVEKLLLSHDNTDGQINTSSGKLIFGTAGTTEFEMDDTGLFGVESSSGPYIQSGTGSASRVSFAPNKTDLNTGLLHLGGDDIGMIAGQVIGTAWKETSFQILQSHQAQYGQTAATTQTQGQGSKRSSYIIVDVCANENDTITLAPPSRGPGTITYVLNKGAETLQVFPISGDGIDGLGVDNPDFIPSGKGKLYIASELSPDIWTTFQPVMYVSDVLLDNTVGAPDYTTALDYLDIAGSAGTSTGGVVTDNGDGTAAITEWHGWLRSGGAISSLYSAKIAADASFALTDNVINYVYAEYNSGTPQFAAYTSQQADNYGSTIVAGIHRVGTTLHITDGKFLVPNFPAVWGARSANVDGIVRESGGITSETGTRNIAITAGTWWLAQNQYTTTAKDTSAADRFNYYYQDGVGGFTVVPTQSVIDNTQYDDGSGSLATLTTNRYGVHWVYTALDDDVYVLYGRGNYTLTQADAATPPSNIPDHIYPFHGVLLGKIIIRESTSVFISVQNPFTVQFSTSGAVDHGDLAGLTDDDHTQYFLADGTRQLDGTLTIRDPGLTDYIDVYHDGTDLNHEFVNTVDVNYGEGTSKAITGKYYWVNADDDVFMSLELDTAEVDRAILSLGGGLAQINFLESGRAADEGNWMQLANNTDMGFWTTTDAAPNTAAVMGLVIERGTGTAVAGVRTNNNYLLEGDAASRNVIRTITVRVDPGSTPGTNYNLTFDTARNFNPGAAQTNATNMTASTTNGSFTSNANSRIMTYDSAEVVIGIISASIQYSDANNSTQPLTLDAHIATNKLNWSLIPTPGNTTQNHATMTSNAGDFIILTICYVTNS